MITKPRNILFASDLSVDMKKIFEHAVAMPTLTKQTLSFSTSWRKPARQRKDR